MIPHRAIRQAVVPLELMVARPLVSCAAFIVGLFPVLPAAGAFRLPDPFARER
jgi:hypothetical protein